MYIKRHLEKTLARDENMFGAILVAGSRQVGKTTLLCKAKAALPYITLDDPIMRASAVAAYLTRWNTPDVLQFGAMAGAFFESFVISEILKSYANDGVLDPPLYFFRDKEQNEIDLLIQRDQTLYPIEIKKTADPRPTDVKTFGVLDKIPGVTRGSGGLICLYERPAPLSGEDMVIPLACL